MKLALLAGLALGMSGRAALGQVLTVPAQSYGQTVPAPPAALPVFDVVSVKESKGGPGPWGMDERDGKLEATNVTLITLLASAYDVREGLVFMSADGVAARELPGWMMKEHFDVLMKVSDPDMAQLKKLTDAQNEAMLRVGLEDRFGLKVHKETRMLPVYDLVIAKGGMKLKPVRVTTEAEQAAGAEKTRGGLEYSQGRIEADAAPLGALIAVLSEVTNRTVVDQTGLTGKYDFSLRYLPEGRPEVADSPADLYTALEEQLGLKLKPDKGPVEVLIVDAVKLPTEN